MTDFHIDLYFFRRDIYPACLFDRCANSIGHISIGYDLTQSLLFIFVSSFAGLIFVVDSTEREQMQEAKEELDELLNEDDLKTAALIVFANKQVKF